MTMTNEEIVRHYRQAKDKRADIAILAELNATCKDKIIDILSDAQVKVRTRKKSPPCSPEQVEIIKRGVADGLTATKIAELLGCSKQVIYYQIRKLEKLMQNNEI